MNWSTDYLYKIRRKSDGKFSMGGTEAQFNKRGKAWTSIGNLKNHLNLFVPQYITFKPPPWPYDDCEVVVYRIVTDEIIDDNYTRILQEYKTKKPE